MQRVGGGSLCWAGRGSPNWGLAKKGPLAGWWGLLAEFIANLGWFYLSVSEKYINFAVANGNDEILRPLRDRFGKSALWCNGSTQVSGTFSEGSNPSKATLKNAYPKG